MAYTDVCRIILVSIYAINHSWVWSFLLWGRSWQGADSLHQIYIRFRNLHASVCAILAFYSLKRPPMGAGPPLSSYPTLSRHDNGEYIYLKFEIRWHSFVYPIPVPNVWLLSFRYDQSLQRTFISVYLSFLT